MQINVNKPYLPSLKKYTEYIQRIWDSSTLTNFGPLHDLLENRLAEYLGVKSINMVSNGTVALQVAYRLLGLKSGDKIISTPFSFVATINTAIWEGLNVDFCDINQKSFNLDVEILESMLKRKKYKAILGVHVFGNPCEVEKIEELARMHDTKIIYDAAHAFGVKYGSRSVLNYGDISTISFHATKLFHTVEGGAIINSDPQTTREMINFGLRQSSPNSLGINAKLNEFSAAMGLAVLDDINIIMEKRQEVYESYKRKLSHLVTMQEIAPNASNNFHYFPIVLESQKQLERVIEALNENGIFPRRYFYPSLDTLGFKDKGSPCEVSRSISQRILCLPIFVGLEESEITKITNLVSSRLSEKTK